MKKKETPAPAPRFTDTPCDWSVFSCSQTRCLAVSDPVFLITALFNNMRTLKFKSRPTNAFFAVVNQMFGGFSQLTRALLRCLNCAQRFDYRALGSSRRLEEPSNIWLTVAKNAFVGWALNFSVRMLLKGAVMVHQFKIRHSHYKPMGSRKTLISTKQSCCTDKHRQTFPMFPFSDTC